MGVTPVIGPFAGIRRWLRERSPLITRRAHDARIAELRSAADGLLDSVQTLGEATRSASSAWTENAQVWQATAARPSRPCRQGSPVRLVCTWSPEATLIR